jgi:hypothetical protein
MIVDGQLIRAGIERLATLPTSDNFEGREVLLASDNKVYVYRGAAYTPVDYELAAAGAANQILKANSTTADDVSWVSDILLDGVSVTFGLPIVQANTYNLLHVALGSGANNLCISDADLSGFDFGFSNTIVGLQAGENLNDSSEQNVFVGERAGKGITTGRRNTMVGFDTSLLDTGAFGNTWLGYRAGNFRGNDVSEVVDNTVAIGYFALDGFNQTGNLSGCVAIGSLAGSYAQGRSAVYIGASAGESSDGIMDYVIGIGQNAMSNVNNAQNTTKSIGIGFGAGESSTAQNGIYIGENAGQNNTGLNCVCIGTNTGWNNSNDNRLIIGNTANDTFLTADMSTAADIKVADKFLLVGYQSVLVDGASVVVDFAINAHIYTLNTSQANVALTTSNASAGKSWKVQITASANVNLTYDATAIWLGGTPLASMTTGEKALLEYSYDGVNYYIRGGVYS